MNACHTPTYDHEQGGARTSKGTVQQSGSTHPSSVYRGGRDVSDSESDSESDTDSSSDDESYIGPSGNKIACISCMG